MPMIGIDNDLVISAAKAASKELDGLITSINQRYPLKQKDGKDHPKAGYFIPEVVSLERNAIIPLEFNVMMDGIAGIIPLNVFKVNPERLPLGYQREDIVFIVKGETQKITAGGDWTTEINGQLTLLDISPNKEGTNPIPEEIKNDNQTEESRKIIVDSLKPFLSPGVVFKFYPDPRAAVCRISNKQNTREVFLNQAGGF